LSIKGVEHFEFSIEKKVSENKSQFEITKINTMNRISLLVAVCLVLGVCINKTTSKETLSHIFNFLDRNKDMAVDKDEINKFASLAMLIFLRI
jgi:hypothetical protein